MMGVVESQNSPSPPVTIRQFGNMSEALCAQGCLDAAGIESFLTDTNIGRIDWPLTCGCRWKPKTPRLRWLFSPKLPGRTPTPHLKAGSIQPQVERCLRNSRRNGFSHRHRRNRNRFGFLLHRTGLLGAADFRQ